MIYLVYIASAFNASFMYIGVPILTRYLPHWDWVLVGFGISSMSIFTAFDFAANSILGRGQKIGEEDKFIDIYKRYRLLAVIVCVLVTMYLWIKGQNIIWTKSNSTGEALNFEILLIPTLGAIFYFTQIQSIALNGLKLNSLVSRNAILGSSFRWLGPLFCIFGFNISGASILLFCIGGYAIEYFLSYIAIKSKIESYERSFKIFTAEWKPFFKNSMLLSIGALVSQIDKILLFGKIPPNDYANYILIITFCQMPLLLQYPLQRYMLPRYAQIFTHAKLKMLILFLILANFVIGVFSPYLFSAWSNISLDRNTFLYLRLISLAMFMHCIFSYLHGVIVFHGQYRLIFNANLVALVVASMILFFMNGIEAAAYSWLAISTIQLFCGVYYLFKYQIKSRVCK